MDIKTKLEEYKQNLLSGVQIDIDELNSYLNPNETKEITEQTIFEEQPTIYQIHGFNGNLDTYQNKIKWFKPYALSKNKFNRCLGKWETLYTVARKKDKPYTLKTFTEKETIQTHKSADPQYHITYRPFKAEDKIAA